MDIIVTPTAPGCWDLIDLLGRRVGMVKEAAPDEYRITPGERVSASMRAMKHGPFVTLDKAFRDRDIHPIDLPVGTGRRLSSRAHRRRTSHALEHS